MNLGKIYEVGVWVEEDVLDYTPSSDNVLLDLVHYPRLYSTSWPLRRLKNNTKPNPTSNR